MGQADWSVDKEDIQLMEEQQKEWQTRERRQDPTQSQPSRVQSLAEAQVEQPRNPQVKQMKTKEGGKGNCL